MAETNMPAAEAGTNSEHELASYELAFHVLPTVAEGEVTTVFQTVKDVITSNGGTITSEEAPERFDLAYEIIKYLEGRNRKFTSAYFGWVRFTADPAAIAAIDEAVGGTKELLRHLLVKLTREEEAHPFYFHEALAEQRITDVDVDAEEPAETAAEDKPAATDDTAEEPAADTDKKETESETVADDGGDTAGKV